MPKQTVPVTSPIKGINRVVNREGQPPDTCWDALNMLPFDRYGRHRVSQRPGTSKAFTTQMSGNTRVQGMLQVSDIVYPATLTSTGLVVFTEPFNSLPEVQSHFNNIPAGFTVTGGGLVVPTNFVPAGGSQPIVFAGQPVGVGTYNFKVTASGASLVNIARIYFGLGYVGTGWTTPVGTSVPGGTAGVWLILDIGTDSGGTTMFASGTTYSSISGPAFSFDVDPLPTGVPYVVSLIVTAAGTAGASFNGVDSLNRTSISPGGVPFMFVQMKDPSGSVVIS
jgi:hypothetical protein